MPNKVVPNGELLSTIHALEKYVAINKKYTDTITLAAAHIEDAKKGRGAHGKSYAMSSSASVRVAYNILFSPVWNSFCILVIIGHCLLLFQVENSSIYSILEGVCLFLYTVDIVLIIIFYTIRNFFSLTKTALKSNFQFLLTILFIIDFCIIIYKHVTTEKTLDKTFIPFQCTRPLMFIIKIKTVYHIFMVVVKTFARIVKTLLAIIMFVLFFACIAIHVFAQIYNLTDPGYGQNVYIGQFDQVGTAFVRLFVLLTTENYPDIMILAYQANKTTFIYFVIFVYLGVFILLSILLAIVVDNYWTIAKMNVKRERLRGRKQLALAWNLLGDGEDKLSVYDENILAVFKKLKPWYDDEEIILLLQQLSNNINRSIIEYKSWLTRVTDILDLEIERPSSQDSNIVTGLVKKSGGKCMIYLTLTIQSAFLQRSVLILLYLHTFLFAVYKYEDPQPDGVSLELLVQWCRAVLSVLFLLEVVIRAIVLGYLHWGSVGSYGGKSLKNQIHSWLKRIAAVDVLDIILVIVGCAANGLWFVAHSEKSYTYKGICVVISSILFLLRLLVNSAQARKGYVLLRHIIPVMFDLSAIFFITVYFFAALCETVFASFSNDTISDDYSHSEYDCGIGFKNFKCSLFTVFQIVTTSNWHEILQSTLDAAGWWVSFIFIPMYIILHMVIINLFVAIAYEAYIKFVSKPRQNRVSKKSSAKKSKSIRKRIGYCFKQYTAGSRKTVSSSPRPPRRMSVTIKRKSLHGIHEKISDSSLGENTTIPVLPKKDSDHSDEEAALSSLPREKRQEMILKKRMQKKAEAKGRVRRARNTPEKPMSFVDVVRVYTAKDDSEVSLVPGQKVKVLEKVGARYKGLVVDGANAGTMGWFPTIVVSSFVSEMNKTKETRAHTPSKSDSQPKFVKKQTADWTKDIIGPMTIMNPEELKELNKILKANARGSRSTNSLSESTTKPASSPEPESKPRAMSVPKVHPKKAAPSLQIMNAVVEEEEPEEDDGDDDVFVEISKLYTVPEVVIEQSSVIIESEEEKIPDMRHLQSPKSRTENKAKERWKRKSITKVPDMPEWAKKFMSQSNVKMADANTIKSPTESESTDPLSAPPSSASSNVYKSQTSLTTPTSQPDKVPAGTTPVTSTTPDDTPKETVISIPEPRDQRPMKEKKASLKVSLPWKRSQSKDKGLVIQNISHNLADSNALPLDIVGNSGGAQSKPVAVDAPKAGSVASSSASKTMHIRVEPELQTHKKGQNDTAAVAIEDFENS